MRRSAAILLGVVGVVFIGGGIAYLVLDLAGYSAGLVPVGAAILIVLGATAIAALLEESAVFAPAGQPEPAPATASPPEPAVASPTFPARSGIVAVPPPKMPSPPTPACPACGRPTVFNAESGRWFCPNDRRYV